MKNYSIKKFLNKKSSASTGSISVFDGQAPWTKKKQNTQFVEIADCNQSARIHRCDQDSEKDFINKVGKMISILKKYKKHLKKS